MLTLTFPWACSISTLVALSVASLAVWALGLLLGNTNTCRPWHSLGHSSFYLRQCLHAEDRVLFLLSPHTSLSVPSSVFFFFCRLCCVAYIPFSCLFSTVLQAANREISVAKILAGPYHPMYTALLSKSSLDHVKCLGQTVVI